MTTVDGNKCKKDEGMKTVEDVINGFRILTWEEDNIYNIFGFIATMDRGSAPRRKSAIA